MNAAFNTRLNPRLGKRQRLTVDNTVRQFTSTNYVIAPSTDGKLGQRICEGAVLQVVTDQIYYTLDGSTPSSTVGFTADPGDYIYLGSYQQVKEFRALRVTTDAAVEAQFMFPV